LVRGLRKPITDLGYDCRNAVSGCGHQSMHMYSLTFEQLDRAVIERDGEVAYSPTCKSCVVAQVSQLTN
jgi:hypothetical protein